MLQRLVVDPAQLDSAQLRDRQVTLTEAQRHYLCRVLRLGPGDRVVVMDGRGQSWLAEMMAPGDQANLQLLAAMAGAEARPTELPVAVTLVAALPKGNGFDEVVRQCTELGVASILPVISDRTLLHPSPQKLERWRRIAQEAAEQSERQVVPTLLAPLPFAQSLRMLPSTEAKYLCAERSTAAPLLACLQATTLPPTMAIAVGPEGGWTTAEIEGAIAMGYRPVSLGARILRAVTAPVAALSLIAAVGETNPSPRIPPNPANR